MDFSKLLEQENKIRILIEEGKNDLVSKIKKEKSILKKGKSSIGYTIKFSQLENWNLSPEYYISDVQGDLVNKALSSCDTVEKLKNHIENMVETKRIIIKGNKYALNKQTIKVLENCLNG